MRMYIVQQGDTLWKIARQHNVDFEQLKQLNSQLANYHNKEHCRKVWAMLSMMQRYLHSMTVHALERWPILYEQVERLV